MTREQALEEATKRWSPEGDGKSFEVIPFIRREGILCETGRILDEKVNGKWSMKGAFCVVLGRGTSWEEAFLDADATIEEKTANEMV